MTTDILYTSKNNRVRVSSDFDSAIEIITVMITLPEELNYSILKEAIRAMNYEIDSFKIDKPYSEFDCTGRPFTTSMEIITRFLSRGVDRHVITAVLKHYISIDC